MIKKELEKTIKQICQAITVENDHSYKVYGKPQHVAYQQPYMQWNKPLHNFGQNEGEQNQMKTNFLQHLSGTIYNLFYCPGIVSEANVQRLSNHPPLPPQEERDRFMDKLSEVNTTKNSVNPYWQVYSMGQNGTAFVTKNGEVRQLFPATYENANPAETSLQMQSMVHLKIVKENRELQSVFYHVFGDELVSQQSQLVRIYFHIHPDGSEALVNEITRILNTYKIPFSFKCLNHPALYNRSDSAVLYFDQIYSRLVFVLLDKVISVVKRHLQKEVPLFSRVIVDGVSFAEDPGSGQSFGMSRSMFIATGLYQCFEKAIKEPDLQVAEIKRILQHNGMDLNHIHLRPNSKFPYQFPQYN